MTDSTERRAQGTLAPKRPNKSIGGASRGMGQGGFGLKGAGPSSAAIQQLMGKYSGQMGGGGKAPNGGGAGQGQGGGMAYSGGAIGTSGTGTVSQETDHGWQNDPTFLDTKSAANMEYENLLSRLARQQADYEDNQGMSLRNLGWQNDSWNSDDRLSGYGQAFNALNNDFASRGLMQSSLFGESLGDMQRGFDRQRGDLMSALQNYLAGMEVEKTSALSSRDAAVKAAEREAAARYAAQYGLGM